MIRKTLSAILTAAILPVSFGATAALADDAGSVRDQSAGYGTWKTEADGVSVRRDARPAQTFFTIGGPIEAWSGEAERERRLRGEFPDGM